MDKPTINWQYFCGGSSVSFTFDRYYFAIINGIRVERHRHNDGTQYSIGNIDKAKELYNTEEELLKAIENIKPI